MNFYDLEVWKKSHQFILNIYDVSKAFPKEEMFSVTNQIRRAATSITANIDEGSERYHYKEKIKFLYIARASLAEVQLFLFIAKDLKYVEYATFESLIGR